MNNLAEKYISLYNNQKELLTKLGILILLIILYFVVLGYLSAKTQTLEAKVESTKSSIIWLKKQAGVLKQIKEQQGNREVNFTTADVETSMTTHRLKQYVTDFNENEQNNIDITLEKAPFNLFYAWLLALASAQNFQLTSLDIQNQGDGLIDINIRFQL